MSDIKLFESKKVRTHWDEETEHWYFSVIDVIEAFEPRSISLPHDRCDLLGFRA